MSDRNIECDVCSTQLGTIRDARLRKDITYLCGQCKNTAREKISKLQVELRTLRAAERLSTMSNQHRQDRDPFSDIFGDMFGKG